MPSATTMRTALFFLVLSLSITAIAQKNKGDDFFLFDTPDETIQASFLDNPLFYDAGIAPASNGVWTAWLEFVPGKGDQLWIGFRSGDKWVSQKQLSEKPGDFAHPTPVIDAQGKLWLTYEAATGENWDIF